MGRRQLAPARVKVDWEDLPAFIRAMVSEALGGTVVQAVTQEGGFTPGSAARVRLADGRRAFVKAVSEDVNAESAAMHRTEARVMAALPHLPQLARLLASFDERRWVTLVFEDVAGRNPALPWQADELDLVLDELAALSAALTPAPVPAPAIGDAYGQALRGWRRFAAEPAALGDLDNVDAAWAAAELERIAALEGGWARAAQGQTLLHTDLRSDQLIVTGDRVVVVDWSSVAVGAAWIDPLFMFPSVALEGGPAPAGLVRRCPATAAAPAEAVTAVVAALTGYFLWQSRLPPPPGLPTVRAFQRAQGAVALEWLQARLAPR